MPETFTPETRATINFPTSVLVSVYDDDVAEPMVEQLDPAVAAAFVMAAVQRNH